MPHSINKVDTIIVGQGLAGSVLAWKLILNGLSVRIYDQPCPSSASRVSAGIINPISGHRWNLTNDFATAFVQAQIDYQAMQNTLATPFFRLVKQSRLVKNAGQLNYLQKRLRDPVYENYIGQTSNNHPLFKNQHYGVAAIDQSAVLTTTDMLDSCRQWLTGLGAYRAETFDYQQLTAHANHLSYKNLRAQRIVFCEGIQAQHNPWLNNLPFKPAKGEIALVTLENAVPQELLNWGNWLLPQATSNLYALGATYIWNELDDSPNQQRCLKMLSSLTNHLHLKARLVACRAGIRPSTIDRQPLVGAISSLPHAYCLNGFGSKGCLLIPMYSQRLVDHLLNKTSLPVNPWL